jgi:dipeptidyl aminopeptidase/acylaminoacyl peptidase
MRCLSCAILASLAATAGHADEQTLPVDQFTHAPDLGRVEIAPDGKFLAATHEVDGGSRLAFLNLQELGDVREVLAPRAMDFHDFQWISPTRVLYRLALRQPGLLKAFTTGELLAIDRDGTHAQFVYGCYRPDADTTADPNAKKQADPKSKPDANANTEGDPARSDANAATGPAAAPRTCGTAEVLSTLPADDRRILVAESLWLNDGDRYRIDPDATPIVALLDTYDSSEQVLAHLSLRGGRVLVDSSGHPRFAVGRNEQNEPVVTWQPEPDRNWTSFAFDGFALKGLEPLKLGDNARSVTFVGRKTKDSRTALYRLDLQTHATTALYQNPLYDIDAAIENLAGDRVIGVRVEGDKPEYHWLVADDPSVKLYESLQRAFPDQYVEITSVTSDQHQAIAFVQSDVNPGDYYLVDTQTRNAQYLRSARSWIDPKRMHHKEPIELKARDGLVLHGYLTRPRPEKGPFELVVLPHTEPFGARDTWRFDWEAQLLAEYGYAVLQVNHRGSGGYGEDFERAGYREWGGKMQDDLSDATRWAIAQGIADKDKICIFGTGYGGYAAVMAAVREPGLYQCAAAYDGLFDLEQVLALDDPSVTPTAREYLAETLGTDVNALRARSPVNNVAKIETPLLVMAAGMRDQYVHAGLLEAAMKSAGKPIDTALLDRRVEVYERLLEFLSKYLRANSPDANGKGGAVKQAG